MLTFDEIYESLERASLNEGAHLLFELEDDTYLWMAEDGTVAVYAKLLDDTGNYSGEPIEEFGTFTTIGTDEEQQETLQEIAEKIESYLNEQGINAIIVESYTVEPEEELSDEYTTKNFNDEYSNIINDLEQEAEDDIGVCVFCGETVDQEDYDKAMNFIAAKFSGKTFEPKQHCICKNCLTEFNKF